MAPRGRPRKRKNGTTSPSNERSQKKPKTLKSKRTESYYEAVAILQESENQYLIDWDGTDPSTGLRYEPTWEPKSNANAALIEDWKEQRDSGAASESATFSHKGGDKTSPREQHQDQEVYEVLSTPSLSPGFIAASPVLRTPVSIQSAPIELSRREHNQPLGTFEHTNITSAHPPRHDSGAVILPSTRIVRLPEGHCSPRQHQASDSASQYVAETDDSTSSDNEPITPAHLVYDNFNHEAVHSAPIASPFCTSKRSEQNQQQQRSSFGDSSEPSLISGSAALSHSNSASERQDFSDPALDNRRDNVAKRAPGLYKSKKFLTDNQVACSQAPRIAQSSRLAMESSSVPPVQFEETVANNQRRSDQTSQPTRTALRLERSSKNMDIDKTIEATTRSPSFILNQYPLPDPPNSDRSRMSVADSAPERSTMSSLDAVFDAALDNVKTILAQQSVDRSSPPSEALDDADDSDTSSTASIHFPGLASNEHVFALSGPASGTDTYRKHLKAHAAFIDEFCSQQSWPEDAPIVAKSSALVRQLKNYVTHVDLENEDALMQESIPSSGLSEYDMSVSPKFMFLGRLFKLVRNVSMHIAVTTSDKKIIDKLGLFIKDMGINHHGFTNAEHRNDGSAITVSLVQTTDDMTTQAYGSADAIIAFDNTLDLTEGKFIDLRQYLSRPGSEAPVLRPFVNYSIEHVEGCLPRAMAGIERLQCLLKTAIEHCRQAGTRREEDLRDGEIPPRIAAYLLEKDSESVAIWPLPVPDIIEIDLSSHSAAESITVDDRSGDTTAKLKRPLVDDMIGEPNKRSRLGGQQAPTAPNVDATSQSNVQNSQSASAYKLRLQQAASKYNEEVTDLYLTIDGLQGRFEELRTELQTAKAALAAATTQTTKLQSMIEARDSRIETLKGQRDDFKRQMEEASDARKASENPTIAEIEDLRQKLVVATKAKERSDSRLQSSENNNEYLKSAYQREGDRVMEFMSELNTLKAHTAELEKRASGHSVKLKEIFIAESEKKWREEVEQLKGRNETLEIQLGRAHEQIKGQQNPGKVQTRQGSIPPMARSPRLAPASRLGSPALAGPSIGTGRSREGVRFRD